MKNYFNYFTEIEEHFVRKRGKNLLVSPLDWCLIELWRDSDIPLHVALRGIDRSFESALQRQKKVPRSLFYCHPSVLEAFEEYSRAMVGAPVPIPNSQQETLPKAPVLQYLAQLEKRVEQHQGEVFQRVASRLSRLKSEVASRRAHDFEQIDRDLAQMGTVILDSLKERLDAKVLSELKAQVKRELKVYKKRLSKEMYARLELHYFNRKVRERYQLPEFSLLGPIQDS